MQKINRKTIITYLAVAILLVFLYYSGILKPLESVTNQVLDPVLSRGYKISASLRSLYNQQTNREDLTVQNRLLEEQVRQLTQKNADLTILEEENKVLREQLGFFEKNKLKHLTCNVISRGDITDTSGRTETIKIDRGRTSGIDIGYPVLSSGGIIVGKISGVNDNIAEVCLTNNSKCKIAATVLSQNKTSGIAQGELGLTIRMDFIPQSVDIKLQDIVITSGLEQYIPRGLVIGRVINIEKENNELWQNATIEPLVEPDDLTIVSVVIP